MELDIIERFLNELGFRMVYENQQRQTVIPGVHVEGMAIYVYRPALLSAGDVLHEAGHMAIVPAMFRPKISGDLEATLCPLASVYLATHRFIIDDDRGTEDMVSRGLLQVGESEAQAWSYAAAVASGLDPRSVFHDAAYNGGSADLLMMFGHNAHCGIHGLQAAKMTTVRSFPRMIRWLQV